MIFRILLILLLFPYVGFVQGVDIQPLAGVAAILLAVFKLVVKRKTPRILGVFMFTIVSVLFSTLISIYLQGIPHSSFVSMLFHLLMICSLFILKEEIIPLLTLRFVWLVVSIYTCVGVLQIFIDESILSSAVYRGYQSLADTGRGVRSLASEPSTLGYTLALLNALMLLRAKQDKRSKVFLVSLLFLFVNAFISRSAWAIFIHIMPIWLFLFFKWKKFFLMSIGIAPLLVALIANSTDEVRLFYLFNALLKNPELLMAEGAMKKVLNVPISLLLGATNGMLGMSYLGNLKELNIILPGGYFFVERFGNKNMGGVLEFWIQLGLFSTPILYFLVLTIKRCLSLSYSLMPILILCFTFFIYNSIGHPLPWIIIIIINDLYAKNLYQVRNGR